MTYKEISEALKKIPNIKTKDIDLFNKSLIKQNADVSELEQYALKDSLVHRTYFQVSLAKTKNFKEQFEFIEQNAHLLQDWWHVDQLPQFLCKPIDFDFAFKKSQKYIKSQMPFLRRWGYVLFLSGLQKNPQNTSKILSLIKDDDEYYVQMAQAWLIADLAVFNEPEVKKFLETTNIKYNITGKAVQKMCDSFRISFQTKTFVKNLRPKLKQK